MESKRSVIKEEGGTKRDVENERRKMEGGEKGDHREAGTRETPKASHDFPEDQERRRHGTSNTDIRPFIIHDTQWETEDVDEWIGKPVETNSTKATQKNKYIYV